MKVSIMHRTNRYKLACYLCVLSMLIVAWVSAHVTQHYISAPLVIIAVWYIGRMNQICFDRGRSFAHLQSIRELIERRLGPILASEVATIQQTARDQQTEENSKLTADKAV